VSQKLHLFVAFAQQADGMLRENESQGAYVMRKSGADAGFGEKERMRSQINAQIEEFLRRGGQITTCDQTPTQKNGKSVGEIWHSPDELLSILED
jgi:hypothetical protein